MSANDKHVPIMSLRECVEAEEDHKQKCGCHWIAELAKWFSEHPEAVEALLKERQ